MNRRGMLTGTAAVMSIAGLRSVAAQPSPSKGMKIIVPFAPGGSGDITARLVAQHITATTSQPVVVENKPGANGIIGVEAAKASPADGQTLVLATTSTHSANVSLFRKLPYDPEKDFTLVGVFGSSGSYLLVRPESSFASLSDLVAYGRANPGRLNYGHFNASSMVPGALMKSMAGVDMTPVAYKQIGNAIADLISGQIQVIFADTTAGDTYVTSGQLRALAVTRLERIRKYPALPTIHESFPGFESTGFLGVAVHSGAPAASKQSLNDLVNAAIMAEPMHSRLINFGFTPKPMSLAECAAFASRERAKWAQYVALAKIEPQ